MQPFRGDRGPRMHRRTTEATTGILGWFWRQLGPKNIEYKPCPSCGQVKSCYKRAKSNDDDEDEYVWHLHNLSNGDPCPEGR